MGNNLIRGTQSLDISLKHPKFTRAQLISFSNQQHLRVFMPSDESPYKNWKDILHKSNHLQHQHLLLPLNHKFVTKGLCASTGQVQIDFPNHSVLLSEEIANRQAKHLAFTEGQLWYLLYALLSAKSYIKESSKAYPCELIGDVRPQNVFINPQGEVRFGNLLSWPGQKINYHKTFDGVVTYLSPEDYETLQLGKLNNDSNHNSSENFSIGFTLLSSALLIDHSDIYDIQKQKFNHYEAERRINAFKVNKSYSELLRTVVSGFCVFNPSKRMVWNDVWNWIRKYQKNISQRKDFPVDQIPPSLNQRISSFRSQVSQIKPEKIYTYGKSNENKKIQTSFKDEKTKFQARQIIKSSQGFYSPRNLVSSNGQQTKVYIQYKSPGKDTSEAALQIVNAKKESLSQNNQLKKEEVNKDKQQKLKFDAAGKTNQGKTVFLDQIQFNIQDKDTQNNQKNKLQPAQSLNMKTVFKPETQKPQIQTQTFAQKIDTIKDESHILEDLQKLQQIKKQSDKMIFDISSENKEQKQIIEQKFITVSTKAVPVVLQRSQEISLESSAEILSKNNAQGFGNLDGESLNDSTRRSRSGSKKDFLDDVMEVNKVLNHSQIKDYAKENKYLNIEEGYGKKQ